MTKQPPDLEEILRRGQARLRSLEPSPPADEGGITMRGHRLFSFPGVVIYLASMTVFGLLIVWVMW